MATFEVEDQKLWNPLERCRFNPGLQHATKEGAPTKSENCISTLDYIHPEAEKQ